MKLHGPTLEQRVTLLLVGVAALVALVLMMLPIVTSSGSTLDKQAQSQEVATCKSNYRADIDVARSDLDVASAESQEAIRRGLSALALDDYDTVIEIAAENVNVSAKVDEAIQRLTQATDDYSAGVEILSDEGEEAFLTLCEERYE